MKDRFYRIAYAVIVAACLVIIRMIPTTLPEPKGYVTREAVRPWKMGEDHGGIDVMWVSSGAIVVDRDGRSLKK